MKSSDDIGAMVREVLRDNFGIPESSVTPDAKLFTDLDLDSLDAIDMAGKLETETGIKLKESEFKAIRTVQDVVDAIKRKIGSEEAT